MKYFPKILRVTSGACAIALILPTVSAMAAEQVTEEPIHQKGDHFLCYKPVGAQPVNIELGVKDQFGLATIAIGLPVLHCNPATKTHDDVIYGVSNRQRHLVCYSIIKYVDPKKKEDFGKRSVTVNNQIGPNAYTLTAPEILCVPSSKKEVKN